MYNICVSCGNKVPTTLEYSEMPVAVEEYHGSGRRADRRSDTAPLDSTHGSRLALYDDLVRNVFASIPYNGII